jgi:hypothetical protein
VYTEIEHIDVLTYDILTAEAVEASLWAGIFIGSFKFEREGRNCGHKSQRGATKGV